MITYPERKLKSQKVSKKEIVAFHEAGHTVMLSKFHLHYTKVSIEYDYKNEYTGQVKTPDMYFNPDNFKIWGLKTYSLITIQYFSGIISEAFYSGYYNWYNAQDDMKQIEHIKDKIPINCSLDSLWKHSEKKVLENWGQINHLAKLLLEKEELNKIQVEEILKNKVKTLSPPALQ